MKELGLKIPTEELLDIFGAREGGINMYYGMIGNGKTYNATADIIESLKRGEVNYVNWRIIVEDFDDRESFWMVLKNLLFFRKTFYKIPCAQNLYFFDVDKGCFDHEGRQIGFFNGTADVVEFFSTRTDCNIWWDEGQDMFDSYEGTKFSKAKRRLILHTRHYHRTLNIISQRPTAIQVSARGNVNRFYKCVKLASWPWVRFARYEFQEMTGETVDENAEPISVKKYWASNAVFRAYNTDYLAEGIPKSQNVFFEAYRLTNLEKIRALFKILFRKKEKHELSTEKMIDETPF